jgi:hypothetical protein
LVDPAVVVVTVVLGAQALLDKVMQGVPLLPQVLEVLVAVVVLALLVETVIQVLQVLGVLDWLLP